MIYRDYHLHCTYFSVFQHVSWCVVTPYQVVNHWDRFRPSREPKEPRDIIKTSKDIKTDQYIKNTNTSTATNKCMLYIHIYIITYIHNYTYQDISLVTWYCYIKKTTIYLLGFPSHPGIQAWLPKGYLWVVLWKRTI